MAVEYKFSYTAREIEDKLNKVIDSKLLPDVTVEDNGKVLSVVDGVWTAISDEDKENVIITEVEYSYDGNNEAEGLLFTEYNGIKSFVKVGDLPDGKIDLIDATVDITHKNNAWLNSSFNITEEMLEKVVIKGNTEIQASVNGLTQILYPSKAIAQESAQICICTKPGYYTIAFETWLTVLYFPEKGIYFVDARLFDGDTYVSNLTCKIVKTISEDGEVESSPVKYDGHEIQVFTRGLCIGDSITEGMVNHNGGTIIAKKYSYPSNLKRMTGIDIVNAGISGATSKTWYEATLDSESQGGQGWLNNEWLRWDEPTPDESDLFSKSLDYSGFDFAIIHLGINDVFTVGDSITTEEMLSTFNTYINNIISKLKTENIGIKIFLATIIPSYATPTNTTFAALNEKIREIAESTTDVYLVDLNDYSACEGGTPYENQHLTAIGYNKMASEISALISYTISKNLEDFKAVQFIGTTYNI